MTNRHRALTFCWSMIFFRKPVPTFRDHALMGDANTRPAARAKGIVKHFGATAALVPLTPDRLWRHTGDRDTNGQASGGPLILTPRTLRHDLDMIWL
jgi:hypothetical protein